MKIFFLFVLSALGMTATAGTAQERQPNIILIMADDVGWEAFGCYGGQDYQTPNIDRLAKMGVQFAHCYSTPICTTSRVKLMTGKYNFRNYTHFGYLNPQEKTFGHLLQQAGYKTAIAGKWQLNGLSNLLPGHDDATRPIRAGFDEFMLWQLTTGRGPGDGGGERFWNPPIEHNGTFLTSERNRGKYGPDLFCDFVCDFVDRNREQPFFVYYPMVLVHDPFVPTPDTIGDRSKETANKPPGNKAEKKANFVAMVNYMDQIVGRIVDKVEEAGQLENTLILFTADNGTNTSIVSQWNGREIRGGKAGMKDMGTHVPLVAWWKGHTPQGVISDDLIDFTDFYATFAEAAGHTPGPDDPIDGRSFLPQLTGRNPHPRDWVLCHYEPYWGKIPGQFVRNQDYKLYRDGRLYHVPEDLEEINDLSHSADQTVVSVRQSLESLLQLCPPPPSGNKAGKDTNERPIYPDWRRLLEIND